MIAQSNGEYTSRWVIADEILAELSINAQTLRNWIDKQLFPAPAMLIGKRRYWDRAALEEYYQTRRSQATVAEPATEGLGPSRVARD